MKRINSKAALLKKRVKVMHGRAEFAGILYLLGTLALTEGEGVGVEQEEAQQHGVKAHQHIFAPEVELVEQTLGVEVTPDVVI